MYVRPHEGLGQGPAPSPALQASQNPLDVRARAIISAAQDQTLGLYGRAVRAVWSIIRTYYPSEAGKVAAVIYLTREPGLNTTRVGRGASARGVIAVGPYFIEHTTSQYFARRVLQVGHELKHIDQWRAGMIGDARKDEREFLAFHWEATASEPPGTGRVSHSTRVALIDAALGYLNCLGRNDHARYHQQGQELLRLRPTHQAASGRPATPAPTSCTRQP
jgi:hypothetical protein